MLGSLLAYAAYFIAGFATAEARVHSLCASIKQGMSLTELNTFADQHGMSPKVPGDGIRSLGEFRTYGRYGCRVDVERGVVVASDYEYQF